MIKLESQGTTYSNPADWISTLAGKYTLDLGANGLRSNDINGYFYNGKGAKINLNKIPDPTGDLIKFKDSAGFGGKASESTVIYNGVNINTDTGYNSDYNIAMVNYCIHQLMVVHFTFRLDGGELTYNNIGASVNSSPWQVFTDNGDPFIYNAGDNSASQLLIPCGTYNYNQIEDILDSMYYMYNVPNIEYDTYTIDNYTKDTVGNILSLRVTLIFRYIDDSPEPN